jgi:D-glycero-D-manno-heptose 1,7-bisphosphate phosphatase
MMHKTIFLDRDDTVVPDRGHLDNVEGIELLPGAGPALRAMRDLRFKLVLVTNQSGIGRGWFPSSIVDAQHDRLHELLAEYGVVFDAIRYCPHKPDAGCSCRKPMPGLLLDAGRELDSDFERSWMIGNSESDVGAGIAAGCRTIQIIGETDLPRAAELIAEDEKRHGR